MLVVRLHPEGGGEGEEEDLLENRASHHEPSLDRVKVKVAVGGEAIRRGGQNGKIIRPGFFMEWQEEALKDNCHRNNSRSSNSSSSNGTTTAISTAAENAKKQHAQKFAKMRTRKKTVF